MKKYTYLILLLLLNLFYQHIYSQRFAYINSKYILENMPEFKEAKIELNELSAQWQKTIEEKNSIITDLKNAFLAEQILLSENMKKQRISEIKEKEKEALEYQKSKFGVDGELFKKRQELIKPIQDMIFNEIQKLAKERNYSVIFDLTNGSNLLYASPKYDKTESILRKLGITTKNK